MLKTVIVGAGGHAQVIADIFLQSKENKDIYPIGFVDDDKRLQDKKILGLPVLGLIEYIDKIDCDAVIIGIGHNAVRKKLYDELINRGLNFVQAIHPTAVIGSDVEIGLGTVICANSVIITGSKIGHNVIINTGATVDHHNIINDHVHIAPGSHTGGEVTVQEGAFIGIGATIMPQKKIGKWGIVGAGALVNKDVEEGQTVIGVPAVPLHKDKP